MTLYEFILDTIHTLIRNGLTVSSGVAILVLALKNRKLKRYINNHIPRRFRDPQDDDIREIKRDVKAIKAHLGVVEWSVEKQNLNGDTARSLSHCSAHGSRARFVALFTRRMETGKSILGRITMKRFLQKLSSRKFWSLLAALVTANLVLFKVDMGTMENVTAIITQFGAIVVYILSEASIDKAAAQQTMKEASEDVDKESYGDHGPSIHG
jgi:hypothetical protein